MTLHYENKEYVLENPVPKIIEAFATPEELAEHKHIDDTTKFSCIMIETMAFDLQKSYENYWSYKINVALAQMFHEKMMQVYFEVIKALMACKLKEGEYVCTHVQKNAETHGDRR